VHLAQLRAEVFDSIGETFFFEMWRG